MDKLGHIFVKYKNRKIYDTKNSKYVNLSDMGKYLNEVFTVVDHVTGEDITTETLLRALNLHFEGNLKEAESFIHEMAYRFLEKN